MKKHQEIKILQLNLKVQLHFETMNMITIQNNTLRRITNLPPERRNVKEILRDIHHHMVKRITSMRKPEIPKEKWMFPRRNEKRAALCLRPLVKVVASVTVAEEGGIPLVLGPIHHLLDQDRDHILDRVHVLIREIEEAEEVVKIFK